MEIAFHIPVWLLWTGGIIVGGVVVFLAGVGAMLIFANRNGVWPG